MDASSHLLPGTRVTVYGAPGTVLSFDGFWVAVRLDGESLVHEWHATAVEVAS